MAETSELPRFPFSERADDLPPQCRALLREHRPVVRVRTNTGDTAWLVTGYEAARAVFADERFSHARTTDPDVPRQDAPPIPASVANSWEVARQAGLRTEIQRAMAPPRVEEMRPWVRATADAMVAETVRQGPPADLLPGFASALPMAVATWLVGLPTADADRLTAWAHIASTTTVHPRHVLDANWAELRAYLAAQPDTPPEGVRPGLLHRLRAANAAADPALRLSPEQLADLAGAFLGSSFASSAGVLPLATITLLQHPEARARLRDEPELTPAAVEELLRHALFIRDGLPRIATADIEVAGTLIRTGELVLVSPDTANRDPAAFTDPDRFDIDRPRTPTHLAFGHGHNHCPATGLARMELTEAVTALVRHLPADARLGADPDALDWRPGLQVRIPGTIPVVW
ncbi:cytochrome P450 [Nocardiopsis trehalosi]|jgi:cytochrome P450|uniref:cytochrome P450 n=1 Tax=Nocardiopsis trehalosi TaxID=109329 RepID=UPI00083657B3|nr:cytochrome P450 [Nocardiopsis trehalosi]